MKKLLFAITSLIIVSCGSENKEGKTVSDYVPELVIVDSLVIDRLVVPSLLDYTKDRQLFLFFDFKSKELILTKNTGEILTVANRAVEGPNSYKPSYFSTVRFVDNNRILVETYTGSFIYDREFNLIDSKPSKVQILSTIMGDTPGFVLDEKRQFKFGFLEADIDQIQKNDEMKMDEYDFLKVSDHDGEVLFSSQIPRSVNYIQTPGVYFSYDPNSLIKGNKLFLQFLFTPIIYSYSFPELELLDSIFLDPGKEFKEVKPSPKGENFGRFFEELKGSRYEKFVFSNDYLLTWYVKGAPDEEVDALDRRVVGDEKYNLLVKKYKTPVYQIFKGKEKLWEGEWQIKLEVKNDLIYSVNAKLGEDPDAEERDVQTLYFYELR
ncbi:hypothetical protein [Algoriphagus sp.]|uniref:hypothetical protein n=1 Tax=Algoriphagus sp. TaxID=1872435 RepID=UPI00391AB7A4